MAINDIYRVTLIQVYDITGPISHNVFYYQQVTPGPSEGADALLPAFQTQVYPSIDAIQNDTVSTIQIRAENIVPGVDNAVINFAPGAEPGNRVGDCTPAFNAWSFRLNRTSSAVRNGQKRFMGVGVDDQDDGVATGAMVVLLNAVATALNAFIGGPPPAVATYQPKIFRATREAVTIPAKTIPALVQAVFDIENASYTKISHQTSRE